MNSALLELRESAFRYCFQMIKSIKYVDGIYDLCESVVRDIKMNFPRDKSGRGCGVSKPTEFYCQLWLSRMLARTENYKIHICCKSEEVYKLLLLFRPPPPPHGRSMGLESLSRQRRSKLFLLHFSLKWIFNLAKSIPNWILPAPNSISFHKSIFVLPCREQSPLALSSTHAFPPPPR